MAELPLDQAVPRFKANEDRLDTFVNSATGYTTSGGTSVQSIQQFLASIGSNGIDFVDNAKARFGTGNDLEIYHSGSGSFIRDTGTGDLTIDGSAISIQTASVERISVTASGIDVTGTVEFDGLSGTGSVTITDIADEDNMASNSATKLATQQSIKAYVDAQVGTADTLSEVLGLGNTTGGTDIAVSANDDITFTDSSKAIFGAGSDLQIFHDASHSYIKDSGTGNLKLETTGGNISLLGGTENMVVATKDGSVSAYHNGSKKLETTSTGIDVTGNVEFDGLSGTGTVTVTDILDEDDMTSDSATALATQQSIKAYVDANAGGGGLPTTGGTMTGDILFNDGVKAKFGASNDLQIWHNGSDSYIYDIGEGDLILRGSSNIKLQSSSGTALSTFTAAGASTLYFSAAEKLATTSSGINVTGVTKTSGSGYNPANTGWATNASLITSGSYGGGLTFLDGSAGYSIRVENSGADLVIGQGATSGALTQKVKIDANGIDVTGDINSTKSGGSTLTLENSITSISANELIGGIDFKGNDTSEDGNEVLAFIRAHALDTTPDSYIAFGTLQNNGGVDDVVTERMRLTNTGRLGIGTTSPNHELHIESTSPTIRLVDTDGNNTVDFSQSGSATYIDFDNNVRFRNLANAERLRIDTGGIDVTGKAGINVSSPSAYLHIKDDTAANDDYDVQIESFRPNLVFEDISGSATDYQIFVDSNVMKFLYGDASTNTKLANEVLEINTSGIDVTGDLTVSSTIEVGSLTPNQDGAIEVGVIALGTPAISSTTDSTSLRNHIIFDNPNGAVGKINTLNSATSYLTSSDYRLKTDVQEMTGSIDRVKALRPVNFEWIVDGTRVDGFLAHEAQEVVPEAVDGEKDAMRDQQYVESEATGDIYTPAVEATYETIQVELTPAVEAVYETVTVEISPAVEATYDEDGNELTPAVEAVTEEQEQLVTPAVDATYEEQQQELTPAVDEVIHSSDVVEPDELEEGQLWRETTEKVMATRQVPDYQGIDQSKIVPLLTSALQDAIAKIEALETRLEALEA